MILDNNELCYYSVAVTKRNLTPAEVEAAARLRRLWNQKKSELHLTQEKVAHLCGWGTQGTFSHYLQARIPLNTDAILKLAKVLQVRPEDIMPEITDLLAPFLPPVSESMLGLVQAVESLPEPLQAAIRTLVHAIVQAHPLQSAVSEETLRLAHTLEVLPAKKRMVVQSLLDSYRAEDS